MLDVILVAKKGCSKIQDDAAVELRHGMPWLKPLRLLQHDVEQDEQQQTVRVRGDPKVTVQRVLA